MTKVRPPLSSSQAMTRIVGQIGYEAAARLCGKSSRWVSACCDPDRSIQPKFEHAVQLDVAFRAAGGDGAPFHETYSLLLDLASVDALACHQALALDVAVVASECGEAVAASVATIGPNAGANARTVAVVQVEEAQTALTRLLRRLTSFHKPAGAA